jgi:hypothetical protein
MAEQEVQQEQPPRRVPHHSPAEESSALDLVVELQQRDFDCSWKGSRECGLATKTTRDERRMFYEKMANTQFGHKK